MSVRAASRLQDAADLFRSPSRMPLVMGIVNATPDSFFTGSRTQTQKASVDRALNLVEEGADFLDIGGQSTRPGSQPVSLEEELRRVVPVIEALMGRVKIPISIDTDKAGVADAALEAGAVIVNDVSALRVDAGMAQAACRAQAVILMHRGGDSSKTMQDVPRYGDVVAEVKDFLKGRIEYFVNSGGDVSRVVLDPGIGFGKDLGHNLSLIKHIDSLTAIAPVLLGVSRKSFLGKIMAKGSGKVPGPEKRLEGTLAVSCFAALLGVRVLRVHDVRATKRALEALDAVVRAS